MPRTAINHILTVLLLALLTLPASAQEVTPLKGSFFCKETNVSLHIDSEEESIAVPGYSFLGNTHGYLSGRGVYGMWIITKVENAKGGLRIRMSNDTGADAQTVDLRTEGDSILTYKAIGTNNVKKAVGRKLVKITDTMTFRRQ